MRFSQKELWSAIEHLAPDIAEARNHGQNIDINEGLKWAIMSAFDFLYLESYRLVPYDNDVETAIIIVKQARDDLKKFGEVKFEEEK